MVAKGHFSFGMSTGSAITSETQLHHLLHTLQLRHVVDSGVYCNSFFQFCSKGAQILQKLYLFIDVTVTYLGFLIRTEGSVHVLLKCVCSGIAHRYVHEFECIYLL